MKIIIFFFLLVIVVSCGKDNQLEKFAKKFDQKISLKSILLNHNNDLLGDPTDIKIIDTTLLFLDPDGQYHMKAVNINNPDQFSRFLIKGRGPDEFGSIRSINVNNKNEVCFLDDNTLTYFEIPFISTDKPVSPSYQKKMSIDFGRIIFSTELNHVNISTGVFKDKGRFLIGHGSGEDKKRLIGQYPVDNLPESSNFIKGMAYQTFLRSGKDNNLVIAYCLNAGCITFLNFVNNGYRIKKEFMFYVPEYTPDTDQGLSVKFNPESLVCFIDVCVVNNYVFALFSGKSYEDYKTDAFLGNRIFVFTKEGDPKAEISLDRDIRCLDIDIKSSTIYGVTLTPYPKIVKFPLKGTINLKI